MMLMPVNKLTAGCFMGIYGFSVKAGLLLGLFAESYRI